VFDREGEADSPWVVVDGVDVLRGNFGNGLSSPDVSHGACPLSPCGYKSSTLEGDAGTTGSNNLEFTKQSNKFNNIKMPLATLCCAVTLRCRQD
jgi:hypothetical protein